MSQADYTAGDKTIDGDIILVAQALTIIGADVAIACRRRHRNN